MAIPFEQQQIERPYAFQNQYSASGGSLIDRLGLLNPVRQVAQAVSRPQVAGASLNSPTPSFNFDNIFKKLSGMSNQAISPISQSIQQNISDTQAQYGRERSRLEASRDPIKQRYEALIADIKAKGTESEQAQTRITSGELAKRGITGTSTLAQQEIENAVSPLRGATQRNLQVTGAQREQDLLGVEGLINSLLGQESQAVGGLRSNLASIQSNAYNNALMNALPFLINPMQQAQIDAYGRQGGGRSGASLADLFNAL